MEDLSLVLQSIIVRLESKFDPGTLENERGLNERKKNSGSPGKRKERGENVNEWKIMSNVSPSEDPSKSTKNQQMT